MKHNKFYIFRSDFFSFHAWKKDFNDLRAVWYDGESDMIANFSDVLAPEVLIAQDDLIETIIKKTGYKGRILKASRRTEEPSMRENLESKSLAIFPSNDTHVFLMRNIIASTKKNLQTTIYTPTIKQEMAAKELDNFKLDYKALVPSKDISHSHDGLLLANDWGIEERSLAHQFQKRGKPVICLQESVIQFGDFQHRMEWCDFPFIQGIYTLKNLKRDLIFLTGNPRYENLVPTNQQNSARVLINCNFTYGVYESVRAQWLEDISTILGEVGLEYCVAQHPRDTGNLGQYPTVISSAATIHELLRTSSLLITRFSSLIHECLALGRPVIYYNPHQENMYHDFAADGTNLIFVSSRNELRSAIQKLLYSNQAPATQNSFFHRYGMEQHGSSDSQASHRVIQALNFALATKFQPARRSGNGLKLALQYQLTKLKHNRNR